MFFCLHKSSYNFLIRGNPSRILNLLECVFNDPDVSNVAVYKVPFLLISAYDPVQPLLQDGDWITELAFLGAIFLLVLFGLLFSDLWLLSFIFLFELGLNILDFLFKLDFLLFMLSLEGEDLIVCLFCLLLTFCFLQVVLPGLCDTLFDLLLNTMHFVLRALKFFSVCVDFFLQQFVL